MRSGHQEKDLHYIKHKENKMPRAKKKTTTKKRTGRKAPRRVSVITSKHGRFDENVFWNKVIAGFKKLLSPAFPK